METIFWEEAGHDCCVSVDETTDGNYAHDCFEGTEQEWAEVLSEAYENNPPKFYIVSSGLAGCYMRDNVSVFGNKADALSSAQWWLDEFAEQDAEESEE
jgi:hypothetical protein